VREVDPAGPSKAWSNPAGKGLARSVDATDALFRALWAKDEAQVERALSKGADPQAQNREGRSALTLACMLGAEASVGLLLQAGASPSERDAQNRTPLDMAAMKGSLPCVEALLASGALADGSADEDGLGWEWTPLGFALSESRVEVARALAKAGAKLDRLGSLGQTAVHAAAKNGWSSALRALLDAGAPMEMFNGSGKTPLMCAAVSGAVEAARALIQAGAQLDARGSDGWSAACWAAHQNHDALIELLGGAGADLNAPSARGEAPLTIAARFGSVQALKALLALGASLEAKGARWAALAAAQAQQTPCLILLAAAGANLDLVDENGASARKAVAAWRGPERLAVFAAVEEAAISAQIQAAASPSARGRL
jgi:ankyrin repeat protein